MQTTLLGLALTVIVALVAALVGPLMIDWGSWRTTFETEASRAVGMPVRIAGEIDARLLPVPSLTLRRIEAGAPGFGPTLKARALDVQLGLGALVRGEWRADALRLEAPEVEIGLDKGGALVLPSLTIPLEPDQFAIDRLIVTDARLTLADAASGSRMAIERASFRGEARSLIGPFKGEGEFTAGDRRFAYRLSGSRRGDDGGMKLRAGLDGIDRPLAIEGDATLWAGEARPRYEGTLVVSRPAGQVLSDGKTVASVPWRASGRVRGTSEAALIEQVEIQYGPDSQAMKLSGSAQLRLGAQPRLDGVLSSRQLDADRWLSPDGTRRPPVALLASMADTVTAAAPPLPMTIGVGIDNLTLGGAMLSTVNGDLRIDAGTWNLDSLEFRAPGLTQVRASGEIATGDGLEFKGPVAVDSADPRALIAWLEGRADAVRAAGALSLRGDVTLGRARIAIDRLLAEFDRRPLQGRLAYAFAAGDRPARLEASVSAPEFDFDAALAFADNALSGAALDRPGEVALALDFGKASYAGVEARGTQARLNFDASGLAIDRLSIVDINGARVQASGRIDDLATRPRGSITATIQAQRLDGAARLADRLAPQTAPAIQQLASRAAAAHLVAKLDIGTAPAGSGATTSARLAIDGSIGAMKVSVSAAGRGDAAAPEQAAVSLDARLQGEDGSALAALIGLDRYAGIDRGAARLTVGAGGKLDSNLTIDAGFAGAGLNATASGSLALTGNGAKGSLAVAVAAADIKALRRPGGAPVGADLSARVTLDGAKMGISGLKGTIAGGGLRGQLALTFTRPLGIDGRIDADRLELPALLGLALGLPAAPADKRHGGWMTEPFAVAPAADLAGRIAFSAGSAVLTEGLIAEDLRGRLVLEPGSAHLEQVEGRLAKGRLSGDARLQLGAGGATLRGEATLTDAELNRLVSTSARPGGRMTLQLQAAGSGRSPAALVGALRGGGTLTIEALQVPGLDPNAVAAAIRAADQGVAVDTIRIGDVVSAAFDRGPLTVPFIGGAYTIADGRASFGEVAAKARDADLAASGSYDLSSGLIDLRLALTGAAAADGPSGLRPRIDIAVKGTLEAPRRQVDVTTLVSFLTLRGVDREAKRLEAAERENQRLQAIAAREAAKRREEMEATAAQRAREEEAARRAQEEAARRARDDEAAQRARDQGIGATPVAPPGGGTTAASGRAPGPGNGGAATPGGPASGGLPALPPPIDIRPIPTDRAGRRAAPAVPPAPSAIAPETR